MRVSPLRRLLAVAVVAALPFVAGPAGPLASAQDAGPSPEPSAEPSPEPSPDCDPDDPEGYQRLVDITFPVSGDSHFSDDYDQPRGGGSRFHQATDIIGEKLQGIHAAMAGVVTFAPTTKPSYGYMLRIAHDNGLVTAYVHLNDDNPGTTDSSAGPEWAYAPGIEEGVRVERGQWIGYLGNSGNAKGTVPHLHFEIHDPQLDDPCLDKPGYDTVRLNPYRSLVQAVERGDVPPPPDAPADAPPAATVERLEGETRVRTAIALSRARAERADTVILVPEGSAAEALVSAPLAAMVDAPILLSGPDGLNPEVAAEIERLGAFNAYLIGRTDQLAASTEEDLRAAGISNTGRIAEPDPFALSARVAEELLEYAPQGAQGSQSAGFDRVLLALGDAPDPSRAWPDALSAGALAAVLKVPVLLTAPDALPEPVRALLAAHRPPLVQVVGGTAAVSQAVEDQAVVASGGRAERLAGATRYATSAVVAEAGHAAGLTAPVVWTATGRSFPDALAAGPAAARAGSALLLVDGQVRGGAPEAEAWIAEHAARLDGAVVVGGRAAITEDVAARIAELLRPAA